MSATQLFSDQLYHGSIWLLDAQGEARLAACDPLGGEDAAIVSSQPAIGDDAIYAATIASSLMNTIVRVSHRPAHPVHRQAESGGHVN